MPDPGAQFQIDCETESLVTEILAPGAPDPAGFILLNLAQQPAAGSLQVSWVTARQVSNTSGGQLTQTEAAKDATVTYTVRSVPEYYEPAAQATSTIPAGSGKPVVWNQSAY